MTPTPYVNRLEIDIRLLKARISELESERDRLREALEAIASIAGNLRDEVVESIGGPKDGMSRAMMVTQARKIARAALKLAEGK